MSACLIGPFQGETKTLEEEALLEVEAFLNDIPLSSDYKSGLMTEEQVKEYRRNQRLERWTAEQSVKRVQDEKKEALKKKFYLVVKESQKVIWAVVPTAAIFLKVGFRKLTLLYLILAVATFLTRKTVFFQSQQKKYDKPEWSDFLSPLSVTLSLVVFALVVSFVMPIVVTLVWWLVTGNTLPLLQEVFPLVVIP